MKNQTARRILDNTSQEIKDEVSLAAQELIDSANREHEEYELITAEECLEQLNELEQTFTREEVYAVAERSVHAVINNILTENTEKTIKQVINSEIDTIKLF